MTSPLDRAVEVMDRLRSPGGCPWDAAQTHESLARYLVEETYEVLEAIETGDPDLLREELGDLLLQVLFHARLTSELPAGRAFGIDEVATDLVDKLVRRHPHVFAGAVAGDAEALDDSWERQKTAEKGRTSAADGVPVNQPALALAGKLISRADRAGLAVDLEREIDGEIDSEIDGEIDGGIDGAIDAGAAAEQPAGLPTEAEIGRRLLGVVTDAVRAGVDPETALRRTARRYRSAMLAAERDSRG